ncbi:MAG: SDR family NAD(P)-dependent oxidoreductase [Ardenticatenales bacterium]|nr:SDR family NAD(P)-dependent oxidoreductase [Ardenticatenales bacterium]
MTQPFPAAARPAPGVLIVGATSAIAAVVARHYAALGARLVVTGRDGAKLDGVARELRAAGAAAVTAIVVDVLSAEERDDVIAAAAGALGRIDVALIAHGILPDQAECDRNVAATLRAFEANASSILALLVPLAAHMVAAHGGTIGVITSVAGQRGRRENYLYGAAKAAVSTYLQGLRSRLHPLGVAVVDIRPGPVRTPMTAHKRGRPWFVGAERAGTLTFHALRRRTDVAYVPWWWGPVTVIVRLVPEWAFKRTNVRA